MRNSNQDIRKYKTIPAFITIILYLPPLHFFSLLKAFIDFRNTKTSLIRRLWNSTFPRQGNFTEHVCSIAGPCSSETSFMHHIPLKCYFYMKLDCKKQMTGWLTLTIVVWWQNCNTFVRLKKKKQKISKERNQFRAKNAVIVILWSNWWNCWNPQQIH